MSWSAGQCLTRPGERTAPTGENEFTGTALVVDGDSANGARLARYLGRRGFRVVEAVNGSGALRVLDQVAVDVVLLDILMPGPDGLEVLRTVREERPAAELPIIMATARDDS